MLVSIIAVTHKSTDWVKLALEDYLKRFGRDIQIKLDDITPPTRTKNSVISQLIQEEAELIKNKIPKDAYVIMLDVQGKPYSTESLSASLGDWMQKRSSVCFIIGGADGLSPNLLQKAHEKLSLSALTFPHPLAKIILVEQLYRAYSLLKGHPYHRA